MAQDPNTSIAQGPPNFSPAPSGDETVADAFLRGVRIADEPVDPNDPDAFLAAAKPSYSGGQYAAEVPLAVARGAVKLGAFPFEASAVLGEAITNAGVIAPTNVVRGWMGKGPLPPSRASIDSRTGRFAAALNATAEKIGVPGLAASSPTATMLYGALEMLGTYPMLAESEVLGGLKGLSAIFGAQAGAKAYIEQAQQNAPESKRWTAFMLNGGVASAQAIALGPILERWNGNSGGWLRRMLVEGSIMGGSSAAATVATNSIARSLGDEDRKLLQGVVESGGAGALGGALFSLLQIPARREETARREMVQKAQEVLRTQREAAVAAVAARTAEARAAEAAPTREAAQARHDQFLEAMRQRGATEDEIAAERQAFHVEQIAPVKEMIAASEAAHLPPMEMAKPAEESTGPGVSDNASLAEQRSSVARMPAPPPHPLMGAPAEDIRAMLARNLESEVQAVEDAFRGAGRNEETIDAFLDWVHTAREGGSLAQRQQAMQSIERAVQSLPRDAQARLLTDPGTGYTTEDLIDARALANAFEQPTDATRAAAVEDAIGTTPGGWGTRSNPERAWGQVGRRPRVLWNPEGPAPAYHPEAAYVPDERPQPAPPAPSSPVDTSAVPASVDNAMEGDFYPEPPAKPTLLERLGASKPGDQSMLDDLRQPFQVVLEQLPDDAGSSPDQVAKAIAQQIHEVLGEQLSKENLDKLQHFAHEWVDELGGSEAPAQAAPEAAAPAKTNPRARTGKKAKDIKKRALSGLLGFRAWIAAHGGLKNDQGPHSGEVRQFTTAEGGKEMQVYALGPVVRGPKSKGGITIEHALELAVEAGWLPERQNEGASGGHSASVDDLIHLIESNAKHPTEQGDLAVAREEEFANRGAVEQQAYWDSLSPAEQEAIIEKNRIETEEQGFPWEAQTEEPTTVSADGKEATITGELDDPADIPPGFARVTPLNPMVMATTPFAGQVEIGNGLIGYTDPPPMHMPGKPMRAQTVIDAASLIPVGLELDAVPIKKGLLGLGYSKALGRFKPFARIVRIRRAGDIVTALHEVGHDMETHFFGYKGGGDLLHPFTQKIGSNPIQDAAVRGELTKLGKQIAPGGEPSNGYLSEGFAEFVAQYISQPEVAVAVAPETSKWFSDFVSSKPKLEPYVFRAQMLARQWRFQGSAARGAGIIRDPDSLAARWKQRQEALRPSHLYQDFVSALSPLDRLVKDAERYGGDAVLLATGARTTAHAINQNADGVFQQMVSHGTVNTNGIRTGGSLEDVAQLVRGKGGNGLDFGLYLLAARTAALQDHPNPKVRDTAMPLADAQWWIANHAKTYGEAAQKFYDWWERVNDYCAQASPSFKAWLEHTTANDVGKYVPMHGVFDELFNRWVGQGKPSTVGGLVKGLRGFKGEQLVDPIKALGMEANARIRKAHREMVQDAMANFTKAVPGGGKWVEDVTDAMLQMHPAATKTFDQLTNHMNRVLMEKYGAQLKLDRTPGGMTLKPAADLAAETMTIFSPTYEMPDGKYIVPRYERVVNDAGETVVKPRYIQYDPDLYHAIAGIDPAQLPQLEGMIQHFLVTIPNFTFKFLAVSRLNFAFVTNPVKDIQTAMGNSQTSASMARFFWETQKMRLLLSLDSVNRTAAEVARSVGFDVVPEKSWHWVIDAARNLGLESNRQVGTPTERSRKLVGRIFGNRPIWDVADVPMKLWQGYIDFLNTAEAAPRLAEMKLKLKESGINSIEDMKTADRLTIHDAMWKSKVVTTDFTDTGLLMRKWNAWAPFLGPSVQGPRDSIKALARNPGRFMWRFAATLGAPTLVYWWLNKDKDWYRAMDADTKAGSWFIEVEKSNGEKGLMAAPKTHFTGSVLATALEFAADSAWNSGDPQLRAEIAAMAKQMAPPLPLPSTVQTIGEEVANKDFYSGKPLVPDSMKGLAGPDQAMPYTSRAARALASASGMSALRIEHVMRRMTGGFAQEAFGVFGIGSPQISTDGQLADLPVVGKSFVRGGQYGLTNNRYVEDLYDLADKAGALFRGGHEKTEDQKTTRLMLQDAVRALSQGRFLAQNSSIPMDRQAIEQELAEIARDAVTRARGGDLERGRFSEAARRFTLQKRSMVADQKARDYEP